MMMVKLWWRNTRDLWIILAIIVSIGAICWTIFGSSPAKAGTSQTCPPGNTCTLVITDIGNGLGSPFMVKDYLGNPMAWVDIFQMGSTNPVCSVSIKTPATGYNQRMACLGGPPFNATGGYPVLALWDGKEWQILSAEDIQRIHRRGM